MRRAASIALLSLVIVALVGAPITAFDRRHPRGAPRPVVTAFAGRAAQGGTLTVRAQVFLPRGARLTNVPSGTAVIHFASGDVSVDLTGLGRRRGHGLRAWPWWPPVPVWTGVARVPVGTTEQPGRVRVDVTVALADGSVTVLTFGRVLGESTQPPTSAQDPTPTPTPTPQPES